MRSWMGDEVKGLCIMTGRGRLETGRYARGGAPREGGGWEVGRTQERRNRGDLDWPGRTSGRGRLETGRDAR